MVELLLPKQVVVGSIPITRSKPQTTLPALAGGSVTWVYAAPRRTQRQDYPHLQNAEYGPVRTDSSERIS